jgi:hypothetical protein
MSRYFRSWTSLVCLAVAMLCIGVALDLVLQARESPAEVVLIRDGSSVPNDSIREKFTALGVEALETYGTFILATVSSEQRAHLEGEGFEIVDVPQRTRTGRGAYLFDSKDGEPVIQEGLKADTIRDPEYGYYIVQFIGPIKGSWIEALKAAGAEVFDYVPTSSFITGMDADALQRVQELPFVGWVGVYHPAYKISAPLLEPDDSLHTVIISLFPGRSSDRVEETVASTGGKVIRRWLEGKASWFLVEVAASSIADLARLPEVVWMEENLPIALANDEATWVVQSNVGSPAPLRVIHDKGLHGEGQVIAVADGRPHYTDEIIVGVLHPGHETLRDPEEDPPGSAHRKIQARFDVLPSESSSSHGTPVAGIIAGDAPDDQGAYGTWNRQDGHAFAARLVLQNLGGGPSVETPPPDAISLCSESGCSGMYQDAYAVGARIQANGIAAPTSDPSHPNSYCEGARRNDQFVWHKLHETPPGHFLVTSPVGNEGEVAPMTIRCHAQAKSLVAVGASKNGTSANQMAPFSSRGPAADGRLRPLVTAPGEAICGAAKSTQGSDGCAGSNISGYRSRQGTSFAHPAVAGSAALVRQYFTEGWYPTGTPQSADVRDPSAALIKAVLMNGAVEMSDDNAYEECVPCEPPECQTPQCVPIRKYPNNVQGWGRIHLDNSLHFVGDPSSRKLTLFDEMPGFVTTGEEKMYRIEVTAQNPFETTLVWSDYPGTVGTSRAQVNNLDLVVFDPSCTEFKGNNFSAGEFSAGESVTGGAADILNVEEAVLRKVPGIGVWSVAIRAGQIVYGTQPFALVATGPTGAVLSDWPLVASSGDHLTGMGTVVSGSYVQTQASDDVREVLEEVSQDGVSRLEHVWRFDDVPLGSCITLNVEGYRPNNSDGDDFKFSWSETLNGTYTDIPNAVIKKILELQGGSNYRFARSAVSGTLYIKVSDTNQTSGGSLSKVNIDRLEIR